jgi:gluconate kinase
MNLFLLGRPGGGKSTVVSIIKERLEGVIPVFHGDDYPFLYEMYREDKEGKYFVPSIPAEPEKGFNIIDPEHSPVFDIALARLEEATETRIRQNKEQGIEELIVFELARREYRESLKTFTPEFKRKSHFMLIEASIPTSIQRIQRRYENNEGYYISPDIIENYYGIDNFPLLQGHVIEGRPVTCVWNEGISKEGLTKHIHDYLEGSILPNIGVEGNYSNPMFRK